MAKYSKGAGKKVGEVLHEMKEGKLKSGSGKKVTSRKQAVAIALSEAREKGEKVPKKSASKSSGGGKKAAGKGGKKTATKKAAKKSATKSKGAQKSSPRKSAGPKKSSGGSKGATKTGKKK